MLHRESWSTRDDSGEMLGDVWSADVVCLDWSVGRSVANNSGHWALMARIKGLQRLCHAYGRKKRQCSESFKVKPQVQTSGWQCRTSASRVVGTDTSYQV